MPVRLLQETGDGILLEDGTDLLHDVPADPLTGGWMTQSTPAVLRAAVAGVVVFAFVPQSSEALPSVAAWSRQPSAQVREVRPSVVSQIVGSFFGAYVDAGPAETDGQLYPDQTIHNVGIAGPMVVGEPLSWQPRYVDRAQVLRAGDVSYAAPLTVTAPAVINWWYPRTPDAVPPSRLTSSLFAQPVTVPATPGINWIFQRPPDAVHAAPTISSVLAKPLNGPGWWIPRSQEPVRLSPSIYSTLSMPVIGGAGWLVQQEDAARLPYATQSVVVLPLPKRSDLPWLLSGLPLVRPQYANRSILALNPTTPAPQTVVIPWLVPPGRLVFLPVARYGPTYAKPIQPLNADGRSDLPWLLRGTPSVRAAYLYQSSLALNPTTPSAAVTLPWLLTGAPLIRPLYLYQSSLAPNLTTSSLPLLLATPLVRPLYLYQSSLALNPTTPSAAVTLPWITQAQARQIQAFIAASQVAMPLRVQVDTGWFLQPPALVRLALANTSQLATPVKFNGEQGWWPYSSDARRLPIVGSSRLVSPIRPLDPSGKSDLPWLITNIAPGLFAIPPTRSILVNPFTENFAEPQIICIPGSYQGEIYIPGSYWVVVDIAGSYVPILFIPGDLDGC